MNSMLEYLEYLNKIMQKCRLILNPGLSMASRGHGFIIGVITEGALKDDGSELTLVKMSQKLMR